MSNVAVAEMEWFRERAGNTQEVLLSGHWMSRHLKLGEGFFQTNKTLLKTLCVSQESLTQITNPNLQARKSEHIGGQNSAPL